MTPSPVSSTLVDSMSVWLSRHLWHPLWDLKDGSIRLRTLRELERTQWLPQEELKVRQWASLQETLAYAYNACAYYRHSFDRHGIRPTDIKSPEDISRVPILTKKNIQQHQDALISRHYDKMDLVAAKTGGSTGKAVQIFCDKQCEEMRHAAAIRSNRWANWELGDKSAVLWGQLTPPKSLKDKLRNALHDRCILLHTLDVSDKSMMTFVNQWRQFKPTVLFGHSHSLFIFAKFLQHNNIDDLRPKGIVSTSMMLLPHERDRIETIFASKVTDRYGSEEVSLIACECERHDGMHLNIDHLYVELLKDDGRPADEGEEGRIVVTDLLNKGMPLIRYDLEDVGIPIKEKCLCGRGLPLMNNLVGRISDFLIRRDGSLVAGVTLLDKTLTAIPGIEQMQIVQESLGKFRLSVVRMQGYDGSSESELIRQFQREFGPDVKMELQYCSSLPQNRNGKYRFSICNINYAENY